MIEWGCIGMNVICLGEYVRMDKRSNVITHKKDAIKMARDLYVQVFGGYPTLDEERISTNLDVVLDFLNIVAESIDFSEILDDYSEVAGLLLKEGKSWYIYTNNENSASRQRFTIAHELGHYYLNHISKEVESDVIWRDKVSSYGTDEKEKSANAFAAELLMPKRLIDEMYNFGYSARQMAYKLGVSPTAISNRLDSLGY